MSAHLVGQLVQGKWRPSDYRSSGELSGNSHLRGVIVAVCEDYEIRIRLDDGTEIQDDMDNWVTA